jgi:hypothetical protein
MRQGIDEQLGDSGLETAEQDDDLGDAAKGRHGGDFIDQESDL